MCRAAPRVSVHGVRREARWACVGYAGQQGGHTWGVRRTRGAQPWQEAPPRQGPSPQGSFNPSLWPKPLSSRFNPRCRKKKKKQQLATVCKAQPFPSGIISVSAPRTAGPPQKTARRNVITAKGRPGAAGSLRGTAPGRER